MAHQVPWCRRYLDIFIRDACLSDLEARIMETRVKGWSRTKQCMEFGLSPSALDRMIAQLKRKYDVAQSHNPELPVRKASAKEAWMDAN